MVPYIKVKDNMELSEFIKTYAVEINNNEFTDVYQDAYTLLLDFDIGKFTDILLDAGINPLMYMHNIPDCYMIRSKRTSVSIPDDVTNIGKRAFYNCTNFTSFTIPNSVTSIQASAFAYCNGLTNMTIPDSVTTIGEGAFQGCTRLTNVEIPKSITRIECETFSNCTGLSNITIPNGVKSIGDFAFHACSGLTDLVLPNSLVEIGNDAFFVCHKLVNIHFDGTKEQWRAIKKGKEWNGLTGSYTIDCIDGALHKGGR